MKKSIRATDLKSGIETQKPFLLPIAGGAVPLKFTPGSDPSTLLITFHGRIDRAKRQPPVFVYPPNLGSGAPDTISISDPTMMRSGDFAMSWYAGDAELATQQVLKDVIQQIVDLRRYQRLIFMGGSGGGFASLYFSWHFPGSTALVTAPQTDISHYPAQHVRRYISGAWPGFDSLDAVQEHICTNVAPLYAQGYKNTVIYIQSIGDRGHFINQMSPFVSAIAKAPDDRFILDCQHWGQWGHAPMAIPYDVIINWLRVVLASNDQSVETLLKNYSAISLNNSAVAMSAESQAKEKAVKFDDHDIMKAGLLASSILKI